MVKHLAITFCKVALPRPVFLSILTGLPGRPPPPKLGMKGPPVRTLGSSFSSALSTISLSSLDGPLDGRSIGIKEIRSSFPLRSELVWTLGLVGRVLGGNFGLLLIPGRFGLISSKPIDEVGSGVSNLCGISVGRTRSGRVLVGRTPTKKQVTWNTI